MPVQVLQTKVKGNINKQAVVYISSNASGIIVISMLQHGEKSSVDEQFWVMIPRMLQLWLVCVNLVSA